MLDSRTSTLMRARGEHRPHCLVGQGSVGELALLTGSDRDEDPHYVFFRRDGVRAALSPTGLLESVRRLAADGSQEELFRRDSGYGYVKVAGVDPIEVIIDAVYRDISDLEIPNDRIRDVMDWSAQRMFARFSANSEFYDDQDIIPEFNDSMVVVKVSDKCPRACHYCTEPGKFRLFDEDEIRANMELAKRVQLKFHRAAIPDMDEGFLNGSDLLWHRLKKGGVDPKRIVEMFYEHFPHTRKLSAFVGVPTTNITQTQDPTYLKHLFDSAEGLNRVLIGIETGHEATSYFLGKNESFAEKEKALRTLYQAGFKLKIIVQIGMVGQAYWNQDQGRYISSKETLDETGRLIGNISRGVTPRRPIQVLFSQYISIPGTKLAKMHQDLYPIIPYSGDESAEDDADYLEGILQGHSRLGNIIVERKYERALEGRRIDLEDQRFDIAVK